MAWILSLNCSIGDRWQLNVVRHCCLFELESSADLRWVVRPDSRYTAISSSESKSNCWIVNFWISKNSERVWYSLNDVRNASTMRREKKIAIKIFWNKKWDKNINSFVKKMQSQYMKLKKKRKVWNVIIITTSQCDFVVYYNLISENFDIRH